MATKNESSDSKTTQVGKQWEGQKFAPTTTPEQLQADLALQASFNDPDAMSLSVYIVICGVSDPVMRSAMEGHTNVRKATKDAWDKIFKTF